MAGEIEARALILRRRRGLHGRHDIGALDLLRGRRFGPSGCILCARVELLGPWEREDLSESGRGWGRFPPGGAALPFKELRALVLGVVDRLLGL